MRNNVGLRGLIINAIRRNMGIKIGIAIVSIYVVLAIVAPMISPYGPYDTDPFNILKPPSPRHFFGTDEMGRDLFSLNLYAIRPSLIVGLSASLLASLIGLLIGLVTGYFGGLLDEVLMRITDFLIAIPAVVLMIVIGSVLSSSMLSIIMIIALLSWPPIARIARSMVLSIKEWPYVGAAKAIGASDLQIMLRHIAPSLMPVVIATTILSIPNAVYSYTALVFMGVGDLREISWGTILYYAYTSGSLAAGKWWYFVPPGMMLVMFTLALMMIGYGLEKELNPRLREWPIE